MTQTVWTSVNGNRAPVAIITRVGKQFVAVTCDSMGYIVDTIGRYSNSTAALAAVYSVTNLSAERTSLTSY